MEQHNWLSELVLLNNYKPKEPQAQLVVAGPCAIESEDQLNNISSFLSSKGIEYLRGGAFKHRTSPYSFSGMGKEGLKLLHDVAQANNQKTVSEILSNKYLDDYEQYADVIMIGARNMRNYPLIHEVAQLNKPVILKRSMDSTIKEWLFAAEHFLHYGGQEIILCERGVKTFDDNFRNILDISSACFIKENFDVPLIVDPSHGTGVKQIMGRVAQAFLAIGTDGYMLEVHDNPEIAKCDKEQALSFNEFQHILDSISNYNAPVTVC